MKATKRNWIQQLKGTLVSAFSSAVVPPGGNQTTDGSAMAKNTKHGLQEGPKPGRIARAAVTRETFNERWSEEKAAAKERNSARSACTKRSSVVHSKINERDKLARRERLKELFNRSSQKGIGR